MPYIVGGFVLLVAFLIFRARLRQGRFAVPDPVFEEARAWWMSQFTKSLGSGDPGALRAPVDVPGKTGIEYITSRTFGLVEGTIFYRWKSGTCQVLLRKFREADAGGLVLEWDRLKTYRWTTAVPSIAHHIVGRLIEEIPAEEMPTDPAPTAPTVEAAPVTTEAPS